MEILQVTSSLATKSFDFPKQKLASAAATGRPDFLNKIAQNVAKTIFY
jgi:hypothetical protein